MEKNWDCITIGRACIDILTTVKKYPLEDSKIKVSKWIREGGGQASTGACLIAHLGGKTAYVGCIGQDTEGDNAVEKMLSYEVVCDFVKRSKEVQTPRAFIAINTNTGSRTIFYEPSFSSPLEYSDLPVNEIKKSKTVLIDPQEIAAGTLLLELMHENNVYGIFDAERVKSGSERLIEDIDALIVSESFFIEYSGEKGLLNNLHELAAKRKGLTAVTLGDRGSLAVYEGNLYEIPCLPVKVKDTTGAGDNYHAAFAFAIAKDRPVIDALAFASAVASLTCTGMGGRSGFPTLEEAGNACQKVLQKIKRLC
ncbi:MAG: carbohydrate kinase family protein [Nitrospinota bacterium]